MLLGWSNAVQLYLAQGIALVKYGRGSRRKQGGKGVAVSAGIRVIRFPVTLGLQHALAHIQEEAFSALLPKPPSAPKAVKWLNALRVTPLDVVLSAAWCPPVCFTVPDGVERLEELQSLATAQTAQTAHAMQRAGSQDLVVKLDPLEPYLAASLNPHTAIDIAQWAAGAGLRLRSIRPLWSIATQSKAMRGERPRSLILQEPDGFTLLAHSTSKLAMTSDKTDRSWHAMVIANTSPEVLAWQEVQRWLTSLALASDEVRALAFHTQPIQTFDGAPSFMRAHWSCQ